MAVELAPLPYELDALEPHVSARTLEFHYGKHHQGYVNKLNAAIADTDYADQPLESVVRNALEAGDSGVFNNAAQVWNHSFLWNSMSPAGGGEPDGRLAEAITSSFGDIDTFRSRFRSAALAQFGSGWAWLVSRAGELDIVTTANAHTPLTGDGTPLLTLDVWEHAYYLDYQNARDRYVDAFLAELINWDFAAENLDSISAAA